VINMRPCTMAFMPPDPIRNQGYLDTLNHNRPNNDPEKPPAKEPYDSYVVLAAIIGLIVGSLLGFFIASLYVNTVISVLCAVGGGLVCAAAGVFVGDAIKKRRIKRHQPAEHK
jgi:membrane associated rhomboid family serine protease